MKRAISVAFGTVMLGSSAEAAFIHPETLAINALPGQTISVLWLIEDVATPLFGYSLDLDVTGPASGITVDAGATSFFAPRNLFLAVGLELDPVFSLVLPSGAGGVFITANTADGSTALPSPGVNDVLAQVVFVVGTDALGEYVIELGPGSALSDAQGFPVSFSSAPLTITVVPTPGAPVALVLCSLLLAPRRR